MATQVGSLYTSLTLDSASFVSNMKRAATTAETAGAGITKALNTAKAASLAFGGALAAGGLLSLTRDATAYASSLGETAQQIGFTTRSLQELRYSATQAGVEQGTLDAGLARLTKTLGQAKEGSKSASAAFEALGISQADLARLSPDETLRRVAEGLGKISDPAIRAAREVAIFGKAGQQLDPLLAGGTRGLDALTSAANELGVVLDDRTINGLDELNDKGAALSLIFDAKLASVIGENASAIAEVGTAAIEAVGGVGEFIRSLNGVGALLGRGEIGKLLTLSPQAIAKLGAPGGTVEVDTERVEEIRAKLAKQKGGNLNNPSVLRRIAVLRDELRAAENDRGTGVQDRLNSLFPVKFGKPLEAPKDTSTGTARTRTKATGTRSLGSTATAFDFAGANRDFRFDGQAGRGGDLQSAVNDAERATAQLDSYKSLLESVGSLDALPGISKGFSEIADETERAARSADNFKNDLSQGLADAIVNGGNLGDVLVDSFKRAAAEALAGRLFKIFDIALGGGGSGLLSGLFRANGGPVTGGRGYIVGERGPEFFRPGSSGSIVPNSALASMGGGGAGLIINVDARGAGDPAAVEAAASRAVLRAAPALNQGIQSGTIAKLRRPTLPGGRG